MCGIYFKCTTSPCAPLERTDPKVYRRLKSRGPDAHHSVSLGRQPALEMSGFVLWMQGTSPESQPVSLADGHLLFNGDLFDTSWVRGASDSRALCSKFNDCRNGGSSRDAENKIVTIIQSLNGPFALIYLDKIDKKVYFCRDRFGRRSLLVYKNQSEFILSSILSREYKNTMELDSHKIYCLCLSNNILEEFSWTSTIKSGQSILDSWYELLLVDKCTTDAILDCESVDEDSKLLKFLNETIENIESTTELFSSLLNENTIRGIVSSLIKHLSESVETRVRTQPNLCRLCAFSKIPCKEHCTVGILFSGGLDCTILAALAHRFIPNDQIIDLINVAFSKNQNFDTPDRITSKKSYEELCQLFPQRKWNLVEINVTFEELAFMQKEEIADLIFPLQTILDESLGSALWFASQGKSSKYTSTCRIVLTGIGADELFGGYTRHRNAYKRGGWNKLQNELHIDWQRIGSRNLARDDRVISHHGRQARMPYLDETFVKYVLNLNPWERCFPTEKCGPGLGDKLYLRLVAFEMGLIKTSTFPKRALQFGSKIALKKENAKDISFRLLL